MRARALIVWCAVAGPAAAQAPGLPGTVARTGVYFESYSFGSGLAFDRLSEMTIPITITQHFGSRVTLDVGTAFASASVHGPGGGSITHSGLVDTDVRATVGVIPGRLVLNVVGTIPTGATAVPDTTIPLFGATATDLLGFMTPGFGSGGGFSAGFASAFKVGQRWAAGTGASYRYGASYTPVEGGGAMTPGGEVRARFGIEGPFGGGKYFRGALVYTTSGANDLGGGHESVIGDRALLYAAVGAPLGRGNLSVYAWEMRRLSGGLPDSSRVVVPRGNVFALGARLERPLSPKTTLVPLFEIRHEMTGTDSSMVLLGYLVRAGTDFRYRASDRATLVVQAQLAVGQLQDGDHYVSMVGPRVGLLFEWSR